MNQILMDQYLPSGCGFRVISVLDEESELFSVSNSAAIAPVSNFAVLRKWCRQNCSGIWGHSTNDEPTYNSVSHKMRLRHYFAFVDEEDILAVALFMGLEAVSIKAMWPSRTKFMIFYRDDAK